VHAGLLDASVASILSVRDVETACHFRVSRCATTVSSASENTHLDVFHPDETQRLQQILREERPL
jgi:hypothetical protein